VPLAEGYSRAAISKNIRMLHVGEGKPLRQSIAIAMNTARRAARRAGAHPHWLSRRRRSRLRHRKTR